MSVDIRRQLIDLRSLVITLEERCTAFAAQNGELRVLLAESIRQKEEMEAQVRQLETKYRNLQTAMSAKHSPEEMSDLKDRFMTMVREIDDCIAKLEG